VLHDSNADQRLTGAASPVDFSPVTNANHEHEQQIILEVADDPIVADAIFPIATGHRPFQGFAKHSWIVTALDTVGQKTQHTTSPWRV